jgi:mono/diheme cytochrome c family protein
MNLLLALLLHDAAADDAPKPRGQVLYASSCAACHGSKGDGKGPAAVALRPKPTDFTRAAWWVDRTDATIAASIRAGSPGTAMSPFPALTDAEVNDLVAFLHTFKPAPTP